MSGTALESLRSTLAEKEETADLASSLDQIDVALRRHWSLTALTWFTDHGVQHAYHVANSALNMSQVSSVARHLRLSPLEQYLLAAAALLHDVGMNDLELCTRPLGEMTAADTEDVRRRHPERSKDLILANPSRWGLPRDPVLVELVALIAQAHGTQYYRLTLPLLEERSRVRNDSVRGPLLAALVLMADELDLHYQREVALPEGWRLNAVSEAHAFKHRCVVSATCEAERDGSQKIRLRLAVPAEVADAEIRDDVEKWIANKLRRQIGLTEPQIDEGFARQVRFDRAVLVSHQAVLTPRGAPSDQAIANIRADVAADELLDHKQALKAAVSALQPGSVVVVSGRWEPASRTDVDGRQAVYEAVLRRAAADSSILISSTRLHDLGAGEVSDVLEEWLMRLQDGALAPPEAWEARRRQELLDVCVEAIAGSESDRKFVLAVSSIDALSERNRHFFFHDVIPKLIAAAPGRVSLLATTSPEDSVRGVQVVQVVVPVDVLDEIDLLSDLGMYGDDAFVRAACGASLRYDDLRRLTQAAERTLQGSGS